MCVCVHCRGSQHALREGRTSLLDFSPTKEERELGLDCRCPWSCVCVCVCVCVGVGGGVFFWGGVERDHSQFNPYPDSLLPWQLWRLCKTRHICGEGEHKVAFCLSWVMNAWGRIFVSCEVPISIRICDC